MHKLFRSTPRVFVHYLPLLYHEYDGNDDDSKYRHENDDEYDDEHDDESFRLPCDCNELFDYFDQQSSDEQNLNNFSDYSH